MPLFGSKKTQSVAADATSAPPTAMAPSSPTTVYANMNHHDVASERTGLVSGLQSSFRHLNPQRPDDLHTLTLNASEQRTYDRLKKIHYWMDESVTICGRKVGLDPLLGLLPVVGDCASAAVSLVLVARAAPELSRYTTARMLVNVWIDAVTGVVPVVGDLFDIGWKANERNVAIFEDHMKLGRQQRSDVDRKWLIGVILVFSIVCFVCSIVTILATAVVVWWIVTLVW